MTPTCQWLGVAGLAFEEAGSVLLIDPFFTRPSRSDMVWMRRVVPDAKLAEQYAPRANFILVTHPHYDHLMDVPNIMRRTGASAYGTPNTCGLLELHDLPAERIHAVAPGDQMELGPFSVEVLKGTHTRTPVDRWINGPLPRNLRLPLRLIDYVMDTNYAYRITVDGKKMLVGNHPTPADVWFLSPYQSRDVFAEMLRAVSPKKIIPIHWDDFTLPLTQPLRPMIITVAQGQSPRFPPVRRIDLDGLARFAKIILPEVEVMVPEIFKEESV